MLNKLRNMIPCALLLTLTFLLPLKFGSTVGVPEIPMTYWNEPISILIAVWPINLFGVFAALVLASTLLLPGKAMKEISPGACLFGGIFLILFLFSLCGWRLASVWDFPAQNTAYMMGMCCYVLALIRVCSCQENMTKYLLWTLLASLVCSVYSAVNQYLTGFDDTIRYIQEKEGRTGVKIMEGQFANRLKEGRLSGDFAICNAYGGYLIMLFPLLLGTLWHIGAKVTSPMAARAILCLPVCGLFLFLLKETGSRGSILAMAGGLYFALLLLPMKKIWKRLLLCCIPLGIIALLPLIRLGRGFNSMKIRFDYFLAAIKMMFQDIVYGCGWGEFMNEYLLLKNVVNDESPHSPHNILLTFGSQCGLGAFLTCGLLLGCAVFFAGYTLYKRCTVKPDPVPESEQMSLCSSIEMPIFGLCWGIFAWVLHAMIELNYETPGSFAVAVTLCIMILFQKECRSFFRERWQDILLHKGVGVSMMLLCAVLSVLTVWYSTALIRAEMAFDRLHSKINIRFSQDPVALPEMDEVRKLLQNCDKRSPFPFAEVSTYCFNKGSYYIQDGLHYLEEAIKRSPERSAYYMRKYRILRILRNENDPEAQQALKKARTLSPKNPNYYPDGVTPFGRRSY